MKLSHFFFHKEKTFCVLFKKSFCITRSTIYPILSLKTFIYFAFLLFNLYRFYLVYLLTLEAFLYIVLDFLYT